MICNAALSQARYRTGKPGSTDKDTSQAMELRSEPYFEIVIGEDRCDLKRCPSLV